ncbi:MAG: FAD-dependent oxidoreductase [Ruminococcaceae bacterium]|nr:FAD-dependent oxidoreductase [Oscillospiraceae bacterium]
MENTYDIIVIGGGPAGLTAALYARRAGKSVLVLEKNTFGGQIAWSPKVENYPGFSSISGLELSDKLTEQVLSHGAELELEEVVSAQKKDNLFSVATDFGNTITAKALITAVGAAPKKLGLPNEEQLIGAGISFCAVCDGEFFRDKIVAVNGGGNTALQEALYLADLCKKVYLIHRRNQFRGDESLVVALKNRSNVELVLSATISALMGEQRLTAITVTKTEGQEKNLSVDGLFVAIGHAPENGPFADLITLDESGYADSDENCHTKTEGLFVAGDCRKKSLRQLSTAIADGASAALAACHYIDSM